jgi:type VI secretion system protein ImpK
MTARPPTASSPLPSPASALLGESADHRGALARAVQEPLVATVRLRTNRQSATDAQSFREHLKQLLSTSHDEARRAGYSEDDIRLAIYALVVFLDECVLSSRQPTFVEWPRRPLQEELFGGHVGGETFFQNLHGLLGRQDSEDLADVLEVYQLCLLLGFQGRYGGGGRDELRAWVTATGDKLTRIRGTSGSLSPAWAPPSDEVIPVPRDPWLRPLGYAAVGVFAFSCLLSFLFWLWQQSWIGDLKGAVR